MNDETHSDFNWFCVRIAQMNFPLIFGWKSFSDYFESETGFSLAEHENIISDNEKNSPFLGMETTFLKKATYLRKNILFSGTEKARRIFGNENNFNIQCYKHAKRNSLIQWNTQRNPTYENRTMANGKSNIANWFNHSIDNEFRWMKGNACVRTFFGVEDVIDIHIYITSVQNVE